MKQSELDNTLKSLSSFLQQNYPKLNEKAINDIQNITVDDSHKNITIEIDSLFSENKIKTKLDAINDFFSQTQSKENYTINTKIIQTASAAQINSETKNTNTNIKKQKEKKDKSGLNPIYTFNSFICGDNSRFAYNLCLAISKQPGINPQYNPCLIYGGVGLGKTHLVEALGNEIIKNTNLKVKYISCDEFIDSFTKAIQNNTVTNYKNILKNIDVLIIDDIYMLEEKEGTQEFLFNIFNYLKESNKQLIFTCDRPVAALKIQDRLSSRLNSGISADLKAPNYETRLAIINSKCKNINLNLSKEIKDFIASNIINNVRNIEGCINKINYWSKLLGDKINDISTIKDILSDYIITQDNNKITDNLIIETVAEHFKISPKDIRSNKRTKSVINPRYYAIYLIYELTNLSTTEIGFLLGGRDHSTITHYINNIKDKLKINKDKELKLILDELTEEIKRKTQ